MTINIHLDGSRLWIEPPLPVLADGTANKVRFRLVPDSDWDGLAITVIFRRVYAVGVDARKVVIGDVAAAYAIPHEVLHDGWLYIGAVGVAQNGEVRLTTAQMESPLKVSASEDGDAESAGSITPEVADQILALMGAMSNLDTTDKSSLVAAINEVLGKAHTYVVNMTKNADGTYTADKTFAELKAAHDAGRTVICSFEDRTQQWQLPCRLPLVWVSDTGMGFEAVIQPERDLMLYAWAYINNGGIGYAGTELRNLPKSTTDDNGKVLTVAGGIPVWTDKSPCVVNMTKNADGTYTADKTFAELKAAHGAGRTVVCSFDDRKNMWDSPYRLPVVDTTDAHMGFAGVIEPRQNYKIFAYVYINSDGMGYTATQIAAKDDVSTMISAAIGDTATALSDMDSVIGG